MQYVRGSPQDYDNWAHLGNTGWDFASVLPYFKKSENFRGKVTSITGNKINLCKHSVIKNDREKS